MRHPAIAALALCLVAPAFAAAQAPAGPPVVAAAGRAELKDPAGDVGPIVYNVSVGSGPSKEVKYPGLDVVSLVVSSDGRAITLAATLAAPPGKAASEVLEFHIDADNNPKTGVTYPASRLLAGVEYYGTLEACLEHPSFGTTCAGTDDNPSGRTAVVTLEKYKSDWMFKDALIDLPAHGTIKEPKKAPITGAVVQATVDYAAMGLKSGQTIRLIAREWCTAKINEAPQGWLPEIVLTLK
jgi:hypothetical protein